MGRQCPTGARDVGVGRGVSRPPLPRRAVTVTAHQQQGVGSVKEWTHLGWDGGGETIEGKGATSAPSPSLRWLHAGVTVSTAEGCRYVGSPSVADWVVKPPANGALD